MQAQPTRRSNWRQQPLNDGQRFGRLIVCGEYPQPRSRDRIDVRCDCGTTKTVALHNLLKNTRSCGCLAREKVAARGRDAATHGHCVGGSPSPTYMTWVSMNKRCYTPGANGYHNYGGRGIKVCDPWRHDFAAFLADVGERPAGRTLDRIDTDGDYEPGNCRWSTPSEQQQGTRRAKGRSCNPTVGELLDLAGVPVPRGYDRRALAPRVAHLLALLEKHGIDAKAEI